MTTATKTSCELNDEFRKAPPNKDWNFSPKAKEKSVELLQAIAVYDNFNEYNDPWIKHDSGIIEIEGERYLWKIDYKREEQKFLSPKPATPSVRHRVMTVIHSSEY